MKKFTKFLAEVREPPHSGPSNPFPGPAPQGRGGTGRTHRQYGPNRAADGELIAHGEQLTGRPPEREAPTAPRRRRGGRHGGRRGSMPVRANGQKVAVKRYAWWSEPNFWSRFTLELFTEPVA